MNGLKQPDSINTPPLLSVEEAVVRYPSATAPAVKGVSFTLNCGECLGLVGASGCGKSTLARALVGLLPLESGRIMWQGEDTATMSGAQKRECRRRMQMVFQDTLGALNPRMKVGSALEEVLKALRKEKYSDKASRLERVRALLERVELPADSANRFPSELSGGQRQRIGIARALAAEPDVLIADEPVSALDVAVQAQLLKFMSALLRETGLAMLFVSHDLAVVKALCPEAIVMNDGVVVERGRTSQIFASPAAPFTRALLEAVPKLPPMPVAKA